MPIPSESTAALVALLMLTAAHEAGANATFAYRCQQAGQTVYQSEPCAQGKPLDLDDRRTEEQRRAALETVTRNAATADQLAASNAKRWQHMQQDNRVVGRHGVGMLPSSNVKRAQTGVESDKPRRTTKKPFTVRTAAPQSAQGRGPQSGKPAGR